MAAINHADNGEVFQHADGRVELRDYGTISSSPLYNEDLAPVPVKKRNWTTYNYAALWISMAHCIPTYMLASGLIGAGMNWWQALLTILLGNSIVLVPILLNSHPGTKYGIPFPVFARASYGTYGSNLPALMRAIVACGWFGINAWIGGEALHTFFTALIPGWPNLLGGPIGGYTPTAWISFLLFWALNIYIIYRGMDLLRKVENWAAPFVLVMTAILLGWAVWRAGGVGTLLSEPGKFHSLSDFLPIFIPSLTAMVGFWATLSLNMPDFTRFGHSQREQVIGQTVALPTTMTVFAAMSVMITSAAVIIYPGTTVDNLWDPMKLVGHFNQVLVVAFSMFTVVVATLAVNIAANVVSPANDFANAFPKYISFRTGGLITGVVGILMQPWRLLADPAKYINGWLVGYSGGMSAIAGVLIIDYWVVRNKRLALGDLYRAEGIYNYRKHWDIAAKIVVIIFFAVLGIVLALHFDWIRPEWSFDLRWLFGIEPGDTFWVITGRILKVLALVGGFGFLGSLLTKDHGWNWRAVAATLIGCAFAWVGAFVPALKTLYDAAWFVGFAASAISYLVLTRLAPPQTATMVEAQA